MKRRTFVLSASCATVLSRLSFAQDKKLTVAVGWNPLTGAAPITLAMQQQKLVKKTVSKYGYTVEVTWQQFFAGPPATEAMVSGRLDIDLDVASAAATSRIKNGVEFAIIGTHTSHLSNPIMVKPGY